MNEDKVQLEVTSDPENARSVVLALVKELRGKDGRGASREVSLAITKLQEAGYWLGEAMFGSSQLTPRALDLAVCTCQTPVLHPQGYCGYCGLPIPPSQ